MELNLDVTSTSSVTCQTVNKFIIALKRKMKERNVPCLLLLDEVQFCESVMTSGQLDVSNLHLEKENHDFNLLLVIRPVIKGSFYDSMAKSIN